MTRLPPETRDALAALQLQPLASGWQLARTPAGACASPERLAVTALAWQKALVPGTVAASLNGKLEAAGNLDADDWWYRVSFARPDEGLLHRLRFEGLATLAQAWLNGTEILRSRNMFRAKAVDITRLMRDQNELVIVFRSLDAELATRRMRPRWKTGLVANQALRWTRTTLLGRIPAWTPPIPPVGPWGPVVLESATHVAVSEVALQAWADGRHGRLKLRARIDALGSRVTAARLRVGGETCELSLEGNHASADLVVEEAPLWFPHTHGAPELVDCRLEIEAAGRLFVHDCGRVGFKEVTVDEDGGKVAFAVNGIPVFCRGAVWTPADLLTLRAEPARLRELLEAARDAGLNMLRVGGTMAYESDDFYALCDELGILVWQDFMFANMDYPVTDEAFAAEVRAEASEQLARLASHPCIAAYCGGSEVAQQAAMMGLPRDQWCNGFFAEVLPALAGERHPHIPYFPSTPWGGALPMHVGTGVAHYYGVGAYRRPLAEVKSARVRFAAECLGFSNVPEPGSLLRAFGDATPRPHHPRWKAGVPRDAGSGYDFEDVRDHYAGELFNVDAAQLRAQDLPRYYAIARATSGEAMQRVFSEWRAPASGCGGGLVWFYRDLVPGAGWGIVDHSGQPKAAYWALKRAWTPRTVRLTDEGLDGLGVHVINEGPVALDASVELEMLRDGRPTATRAETPVRLEPQGSTSLSGDALLGHFTDSTYAYRFGPPKHDVVVARLRDRLTGAVLAEDFHFPMGLDLPRQGPIRLETHAEWNHDGRVLVTLKSDVFLQSVAIDCEGFTPNDNHFHLAPGREKHLVFTRVDRARSTFRAELAALNAPDSTTIRAQRSPGDMPDETR
ncbi:MAG TPA: hypothetical protein VM073_07845 [Usitatibacter sp.]|nr:hypothetical protein [Usitatibacter sp.]